MRILEFLASTHFEESVLGPEDFGRTTVGQVRWGDGEIFGGPDLVSAELFSGLGGRSCNNFPETSCAKPGPERSLGAVSVGISET